MNRPAIYLGNTDLADSCQWEPPTGPGIAGVAPLPIYPTPADTAVEIVTAHSLARVNGWGSAGSCPALSTAKTPAVREHECRVAAVDGRQAVDDELPCASASRLAGGGVV